VARGVNGWGNYAGPKARARPVAALVERRGFKLRTRLSSARQL